MSWGIARCVLRCVTQALQRVRPTLAEPALPEPTKAAAAKPAEEEAKPDQPEAPAAVINEIAAEAGSAADAAQQPEAGKSAAADEAAVPCQVNNDSAVRDAAADNQPPLPENTGGLTQNVVLLCNQNVVLRWFCSAVVL